MSDRPQKIIRLQASNVKRLTAVEIMPDGNTIIIGGANGQGKSSVLDAICMALGGKDHIPEMPIRKGQSKAVIIVETNDLIVTRNFSQSAGPTLKVTTKDGTPLGSPQTLLDKLIGTLSFDPLDFSRMCEKEPKKAVEVLRKIVGLDFALLDGKRGAAYLSRTSVGRDLDSAKTRLSGYTFDPTAPTEAISVAALMVDLEDAGRINKQNAEDRKRIVGEAKSKLDSAATALTEAKGKETSLRTSVATLEEQIRQLQETVRAKKLEVDDAVNEVKAKGSVHDQAVAEHFTAEQKAIAIVDIDTAPTTEKLRTADELNVKFRNNSRRKELEAEVSKHQASYDAYTKQIDDIDKEKADKLGAAKFPIEELSFNDSGVLLNGVPWNQGSTAEQIRASMAMAIALNPKLKVVMIRSGSLVDDNGLKLIAGLAAQHDMQVWIERVGDGKECSIIIEDGHVKED